MSMMSLCCRKGLTALTVSLLIYQPKQYLSQSVGVINDLCLFNLMSSQKQWQYEDKLTVHSLLEIFQPTEYVVIRSLNHKLDH